ncbi:restriction endonuclease subunit S [Pseudotabrizicola formosa]|uniref:restriction endonuclease subunit S n=1 Tax=Pseudotabrizicola formosa TaxID=2030009 RepID=UPI000CD0E9A0|nr:restriction endonuclease subunit S [Pseudotabrizicola formosa]
MSWTDCELGDVVTLKRGHDLPNDRRIDGYIPVVSSSGITGWHNEARAEPPGVVTGRYGTIGEVFYLDRPYWPLNTALYAIDFHGNDPKFVAYFLRNQLKNYQSEKAAVPGVDRNVLHKIKVRCPDPQAQERIVSILSAYDDLIENNRRRIGLLEQAARLLYREWFVHLRFPGHETVKTVDGLPEGWRILSVEDSVKRLPPGKLFSQATASAKGTVPILDQGKSGQLGFHDEQPSFVASVDDPVIVFANHTCYQRVIHFSFSAIQNVLPFKPSSNVPNEIYWLHHATLGLVKLNAYKGHWPEFKIKEIPVPNANIAARFAEFVRPMHAQMHELEMLNSKLTRAGDLLLPRLMDGRIPV